MAGLSVKAAPGIGYLLWASDDEPLVPRAHGLPPLEAD
jgi:hypothetical protein